jgi:hypothetical protein
MPDAKELRWSRPQLPETKETSTLQVSQASFGRGSAMRTGTPDQEPELFVPSLASKPLTAERGEARVDLGSSANPLRAETAASGVVVPVAANELGASDLWRVTGGSAPASGPRANPLR